MTSENLIIEILEKSENLKIREIVISLAKINMKNDANLSRVEAYESAFRKLTEADC
jgi:hypothetical protein